MRIAWVTDIHLDHLRPEDRALFYKLLAECAPDAILISGDIAEADTIESHLLNLENRLCRPIYFVLGNHDYYRGSIPVVRASMQALTTRSNYLKWLPTVGVVELNAQTCVIGHDGWADGRLGDYENSSVMLNDYFLIKELSYHDEETQSKSEINPKALNKSNPKALLSGLGWLSPEERLFRLHALGDESALYVQSTLQTALERFQKVILVTRVPPFKEACWYGGRISDDNWLPHFTCKAMGDTIMEIMNRHPDQELLVLCGHTHGEGTAQILPNLLVHTGGADYGVPRLQDVLVI